MKYQKVVQIKIKKFHKKSWVVVEFENHTLWMPELVDLGIILSFIGMCEDIKYPWGQGHRYTKEFINQCYGKYPYAIRKLYKESFDPKNLKEINIRQ